MTHQHQEEFTAIAGWVVTIGRALQSHGQDIDPLLEHCGITDTVYGNPDLRIPAHKINVLLDLCCEAAGDPAFPIGLARHVHPSTFATLGYSMMASSSLKDLLQRLARFKRLVSNTCRLEVRELESHVELRMHPACDEMGTPVLSNRCIYAFFSVVLSVMRELYREDFAPARVGFIDPRPPFHGALDEEFHSPIHYGSGCSYMTFDRAALETPLPTANPSITRLHESTLLHSMARLDRDDVVSGVRSLILESLPEGPPSQGELARQLHISRRHLQRKLGKQGTSYKALLEETRRGLALRHLEEGRLSLGEISYTLGFSSVNNFSRAFQRWMGLAPGQYRRRLREDVA